MPLVVMAICGRGVIAVMPATTSTMRAPQQRLPAGEPHLAHPEADEHADEAQQLLVGEHLGLGHPRQALGGHAVGAAQVAAVGDRHPQVPGHPPEGVDQLCHPPNLRHVRRGPGAIRPRGFAYRRGVVRTLVSPRWLLGLLVAVLFGVICVYLGRWQWGKYEDKQTNATTVHVHYGATPVPLASVAASLPPTPTTEWTRVTATGTYDASPVLYVRNRALDDNPGFELVSSFETTVDGRPLRLLVDRGWVASGDTAADLPSAPPPPTGTVTVQGWLRRPEPSLGKDLPPDQLASIALTDARRSLGGPDFAPTYLQLESERTAGGATPARPTPLAAPDTDLGPNQAYAFQWWLFSVFGLVFYGYRIRLLRQEREAEREAERRRSRTPYPRPVRCRPTASASSSPPPPGRPSRRRCGSGTRRTAEPARPARLASRPIRLASGLAADLGGPRRDEVPHDVVRQRGPGREPHGARGARPAGEPVGHRRDRLGAEREEAQVALGGQHAEQGSTVELEDGDAVAAPLDRPRRDLAGQVDDVLERRRVVTVLETRDVGRHLVHTGTLDASGHGAVTIPWGSANCVS